MERKATDLRRVRTILNAVDRIETPCLTSSEVEDIGINRTSFDLRNDASGRQRRYFTPQPTDLMSKVIVENDDDEEFKDYIPVAGLQFYTLSDVHGWMYRSMKFNPALEEVHDYWIK